MEGLLVRQRKTGTAEDKLALAKESLQAGHELAAENAAQHLHWQEEVRRRSDPLLMVRRQTAPRYDAVDMRMSLQGLAPGMQHTEKTDLTTEVLWIGGDFQ